MSLCRHRGDLPYELLSMCTSEYIHKYVRGRVELSISAFVQPFPLTSVILLKYQQDDAYKSILTRAPC